MMEYTWHAVLPALLERALHFEPGHVLQAQRWFENLEVRHITYLELRFAPVNEAVLQRLAQCLQGAHQLQLVKVLAPRYEA